MCLAIPSRVVKIDVDKNIATLDTMGVIREASLELIDIQSIEVDDFVLLHIGFVMSKIDKDEALLSLDIYKEMLDREDEL